MPRRRSKQGNEERMSTRQYLSAIWKVAKLSFSFSKHAVGFKAISAILSSILPLLTTFFAAQTTTQIAAAFNGTPGAKERALGFVLATAILGLVTAIQSSLGNYIDQAVRFRVESQISDMLYEHFARLDFWQYDDKKTSDLYEKSQDFSNFFAYIFDRVAELFQLIIGIASALIALSFISPWLSIAILIAIMPGMVIQYKLSRHQIDHWRENVVVRRKQSYIEYNMIQPKTLPELRLYNLTNMFLKMRIKFRNKDQGGRLEFERGFIKWRILSDALETLVQLGSLIWIVLKIGEKVYPIGQFVFVQQLVSRALGSAGSLVSLFGSTDEDLAKLKEYNDFMELPIMQSGGKRFTSAVKTIRFEDVSFTYPNTSREVISHLSLTIQAGSHIAVVGENGAGKSTLIKLLLGFYLPTSGRIYVNDTPLNDFDIASWHKQISALLQDSTNYTFMTVGDNVLLGDVSVPPSKKRLHAALAAAEASEVIDGLPLGLDTPAATWFEEEEGIQLSGGQWQRIGLARNFYRQSPIVILDEPTSAIDARAEADIFDRLFDKSNKNTVITISHRLTTIENAEQIYVLKAGSIVQQGTHDELSIQKKGEYVNMFRRQLREGSQPKGVQDNLVTS